MNESRFYVPSDIAYLAMGAASSLYSPQYGSAVKTVVGSVSIGIALTTSYIHDTNYFAELAVALSEFALAANMPYQISLGIVFALSWVNKEKISYYHNLLRESVSNVIENTPDAIDKYMQTQTAMYNSIPHVYGTYFGPTLVGETPSDEL